MAKLLETRSASALSCFREIDKRLVVPIIVRMERHVSVGLMSALEMASVARCMASESFTSSQPKIPWKLAALSEPSRRVWRIAVGYQLWRSALTACCGQL